MWAIVRFVLARFAEDEGQGRGNDQGGIRVPDTIGGAAIGELEGEANFPIRRVKIQLFSGTGQRQEDARQQQEPAKMPGNHVHFPGNINNYEIPYRPMFHLDRRCYLEGGDGSTLEGIVLKLIADKGFARLERADETLPEYLSARIRVQEQAVNNQAPMAAW
jgi:hypothetical protein